MRNSSGGCHDNLLAALALVHAAHFWSAGILGRSRCVRVLRPYSRLWRPSQFADRQLTGKKRGESFTSNSLVFMCTVSQYTSRAATLYRNTLEKELARVNSNALTSPSSPTAAEAAKQGLDLLPAAVSHQFALCWSPESSVRRSIGACHNDSHSA